MKTKNSGVVAVIIASLLLFSCKKSSLETVPEKNNMASVSESLQGDLFIGKVTVESDENEIVINYNNSSKYILITKIPQTQISNINDVQSASLITSKYGIVLKDLNTHKVYFFTNNDSESLDEFKTVQSNFKSSFQSNKIFGTTIINTEKS